MKPIIKYRGGKSKEIALEADKWMIDTFNEYKMFTILGL